MNRRDNTRLAPQQRGPVDPQQAERARQLLLFPDAQTSMDTNHRPTHARWALLQRKRAGGLA